MTEAALKPRPHIVLFLTDDHAQWANGEYGNEEIHTPNLDFLAENGAMMANAYTPTPVCSPGRACLLSGRFSSQHGLHDYLAGDLSGDIDHYPWMADETLLPDLLKESGYQTGFSGKWHLGHEEDPQANFDYAFSIGPDYPVYHSGSRTYYENGQPIELQGNTTQIITDHAVKCLRQCDPEEAPVFLLIGFTATHSPWEDHPSRLVNQYQNCTFADVPKDEMYPFGIQNLESTFETRNHPKRALAEYYASVSEIDEGIGRILDELSARGMDGNTLVIYTSDHGLNCGHHGIWGKGNGTLPLNMVEESVRIPMVLHYPEKILSHQRRAEFVDHTDLFQTILGFADVSLDEAFRQERQYPGRSFYPLLTHTTPIVDWRQHQICEYGDVRMCFDGRYKLVLRYPDGPNQLFDLEKDPRETKDFFDVPGCQDVVERLKYIIDDFFEQYADPVKSGLNVKNLPKHNFTEAWRDERNLH